MTSPTIRYTTIMVTHSMHRQSAAIKKRCECETLLTQQRQQAFTFMQNWKSLCYVSSFTNLSFDTAHFLREAIEIATKTATQYRENVYNLRVGRPTIRTEHEEQLIVDCFNFVAFKVIVATTEVLITITSKIGTLDRRYFLMATFQIIR